MKVYLAGWTGETFYREYCHRTFSNCNGIQILDPLKVADQYSPNLVLIDKELMDSCDILVAYVNKPTFGTIQEIIYCYERDIPVFVISKKKYQKNPWLKHHTSKFFNSIDECFDFLIDEKEGVLKEAAKKKLGELIPNKK